MNLQRMKQLAGIKLTESAKVVNEEYDNVGFLKQAIGDIYPRGGSKEDYKAEVANTYKGYAAAPEFDQWFDAAYNDFFGLNIQPEDDTDDYTDYSMRQGEMGNPDRMREEADDSNKPPYSGWFTYNPVNGNIFAGPYSSAEEASADDNGEIKKHNLSIEYGADDGGTLVDINTGDPIIYTSDEDDGYCDACAGTGEGQYGDSSCTSCGGKGFVQGKPELDDTGIDECFDLNNGYDDVKFMKPGDFFPDGADSPVASSTGASGARQGDNPEQKKLAVSETHKELVYNYRAFLKESAK